ncbi:mechanosensitive ion channel family protein [Sphingomonas oligophenolica]|uniref:Mechanosensitive ion channel family protein n=1 Tax=Sphingomonas oligophenolica TaxID=301154 RepID=A0ABU9Y098_9SPHN
MPGNSSAPIVPPIRVRDVNSQFQDLIASSYTWLMGHWVEILIAVGIATVIVAGLFFLRGLGTRLCSRSPGPAGWGTVFGRAIVRTGNFFIIMIAAKLVAGFANAPPQLAMTINFLFTVAAVFQAAIWAREIILGSIELRTHSEEYSGEAIGSAMGIIRLLVTFALFAIALIVVLDNLGVNVTGLVAGLGVGGIAIGLAAQGIFADLFAALAIIFDRPFRRGDAITYDKSSGTVEAIGLKSTRIRAATGEERIIANRNLLDKEILNNSQREYRRIQFTLGLAQWTPVEQMERLPGMLQEIVEGCGRKFVRAGFIGFGDSSYNFDVEFDSPTAAFQDFFDARHAIGLGIIKRLNAEGIDLAYPTQTAFTAAPRGGMIPPYPEAALYGENATPIADDPTTTVELKPSADRSAVDEDTGH